MKLRVSVTHYTDDVNTHLRDVTLTFDATSTVGDVARVLVRGGAGHPRLTASVVHRHAPVTLRVSYPDGNILILDAGDAVTASGLMAGTEVEPVFEAMPGPGTRSRTPIATVTILNGSQEGVQFLAVGEQTTIGRDWANRVELHDSGVSRRHATLRRNGDAIEIEDLGSANGTTVFDVDGNRIAAAGRAVRVPSGTVVEFGTVRAKIDIGPPSTERTALPGSALHLQSPLVDPVFAPEGLELPAPPDPPEPTRFPLVAMAAPLLMGIVLYLATQSLLSLVFIGLSPLIMIGSWLDSLLSRRRSTRAKKKEFEDSLAAAEHELSTNIAIEQTARDAETPPALALAALPTTRDLRLWSRRPEHRAFLELRLGTATLLSRKRIRLPPRGKIPAQDWERLTALHDRFCRVPEVPLLERLDRSGSLGIAGHPFWVSGAARAVLVQLLALHSPADLVFTAFAHQEQADDEWAWLKWLPHVDSAYSPIKAPHLTADQRSAGILLTALEGLIAERAASGKARSVRSRVEGEAASASERLAPAEPGQHSPSVVVLVLSDTIIDRTRLVGLAEDGADVGVHVIWISDGLGGIPAACRTVIEAHPDEWKAHFVRQGDLVPLTSLNDVTHPAATTFARELAPIIDAGARVLDESDLPRSVSLAQLVPGDLLGSGEAILKNWRSTDSLISAWQPGIERESGPLAAIIGQGSSGPIQVDLRTHGPHALVGGTTGSGKSEFLQTWILSLASTYAPDRLTFLLVDYKGGSAFADCVGLPHTVGLVTDLNTHLVRRALTSLRAELRYREELLAEKGAKDLVTLERRGDREAPPSLVIVIDEFAALVNEIPEFVDGVIDIAQRGRSLGLHLVMATQRPAGVIKDNLRANTNLRVALRMADAADSSDVIGVTDAAHFSPEIPGRAAIKVGAGQLTHLQTGYIGGRSDIEHNESVEVRDLSFGEQHPWTLLPELQRTTQRRHKGPRDIELLADNVRKAALSAGVDSPRKPWVDQLPHVLPLSSCLSAASATAQHAHEIVVGIIDEPHLQRQTPYAISLSSVGNLAVYGAAGTGKTTALITFAIATIVADPHTQIYGIDSAGGQLSSLTPLPNTGEIVAGDERERIVRLLGLIKTLIAERTAAHTAAPPVLLLLDGLASFRDTYEHLGGGADPFGDLIEIASSGRTAGVHVLLAAERSGAMPTALASSVPERLVLRLTAEADYQYLGVPSAALEAAGPGRALRVGSNDEIQLAVPGRGANDTDAALTELAEVQRERAIPKPADVPAIPTSLPRSAVGRSTHTPAAFAIDSTHLRPVTVPEQGFLVVTGPAGSGRTTAIRAMLEALDEQSSVEPMDAVLISPRRSTLRDLPVWARVADTASTRDATIAWLTKALGGSPVQAALLPLIGTTPAPESETAPLSETEPAAFPAAGRRGVIVVEDIGGFDGSGNEQALAALLKLLRRSDHVTIIEGENATLGTVWELASPLRGARWALALQPDANDTPTLFTTPFTHARRADYPPGRGFLVENGRVTGIHVALPERY